MKRRILSLIITSVIFGTINFCVYFVVNYIVENEAVSYPSKTTVLDLCKGPNDQLEIEDFELFNWSSEHGVGLNASVLSENVWDFELIKCNKFEAILVCILQNRFNSVIYIDVVDRKNIDVNNQICGVEIVKLFDNTYTVSMVVSKDDFPNEFLNAGFVVYKANGDLISLVEGFETPKEYFGKAFPHALRCYFVSNKYFDYICVFGLVIEYIIIYFGVETISERFRKTKTGDGTKPLKKSN